MSLYQSINNFDCSSHLFLQFTILLTFISLLCDRIKFLLFRWKSLADVQNRLLKKKVRVNFRKHKKNFTNTLWISVGVLVCWILGLKMSHQKYFWCWKFENSSCKIGTAAPYLFFNIDRCRLTPCPQMIDKAKPILLEDGSQPKNHIAFSPALF